MPNDISLNITTLYGSNVCDMIVSKLTAFYSKVILDCFTRLIIVMPLGSKIFSIDRQKELFDEVVVIKFNPENSIFWQTKNISNFYYFFSSVTNIDITNVYIDHGKIFHEIPIISDSTECAAAFMGEDPTIMQHVNKQISSHCQLESIEPELLQYYDFSACYVSDETRSKLLKPLKSIVKKYPEYVDQACSYAIMSWLLAYLQIPVRTLDKTPVNISTSELINDFYAII